MQRTTVVSLIGLLIGIAVGCSRQSSEEGPNPLHQVIGAAQIRNPKERDRALADACFESATLNAIPALKMGIPQIADTSLRDSVAADCATMIFDNGKTEDAAAVANLIVDQAKREELLSSFENER